MSSGVLEAAKDAVLARDLKRQIARDGAVTVSIPRLLMDVDELKQRMERLERMLLAPDSRKEQAIVFERSLQLILTRVAEARKVNPQLLFTRERSRAVAWARFECFWLARQLTAMPFQKIGDFFKRDDHGTVMNGVDQVKNRMSVEKLYAGEMAILRQQIEKVL